MDYRVLALKYRPTRFEEVVGQDAVTSVLAGAIAQGRLGQAYLFSGPRGCGKTTTARILAMALNCERGPTPTPCGECAACRAVVAGSSLAVIEIDAASTGGVEDIRNIREEAALGSIGGRYKIYILDEAHQITAAGANALLKTLEEPPPGTIFVLATTEPQKILPTIHSRCQRFGFRLLAQAEIAGRLADICAREGIAAPAETLAAIARRADGSLRDGLTLLDQALASGGGQLALDAVTAVLGLTRHDHFFALDAAWQAQDAGAALRALDAALAGGLSPREFALGLAAHLRDLLLLRVDPALLAGEIGEADRQRCTALAQHWQVEDLLALLRLVGERGDQIRYASQPRLLLDTLVVEIARFERRVLLSELLSRLKVGRPEGEAGGGRAAGGAGRETAGEGAGPEPDGLRGGAPAAAARPAPRAGARPVPARAPILSEAADPAQLWGEFVGEVSRSMKSLGSFLEQARPGVLGEKHYSVVVQTPFQLAMLDTPEHLRLMGETLGKLTGRSRQIRLELAAAGAQAPERISAGRAAEARREQALSDHAGDPLIQDLLQRFDGELLED
ncbi:DNA polymerase III subunit gamma/tau [bacterium]|nr:DNA polymerase III subunit gamma/tau [bacterium]